MIGTLTYRAKTSVDDGGGENCVAQEVERDHQMQLCSSVVMARFLELVVAMAGVHGLGVGDWMAYSSFLSEASFFA